MTAIKDDVMPSAIRKRIGLDQLQAVIRSRISLLAKPDFLMAPRQGKFAGNFADPTIVSRVSKKDKVASSEIVRV